MKAKSLLATTALAGALLVAPGGIASAGAGDCSVTGVLCTSKTAYTGSSTTGGSGDTYRFSSSDNDMNTNCYVGAGCPTDKVGNHVISVRNRYSAATRACGFNGTGYGGGLRWNISYATSGFVSVGNGAESFFFAGSSC